MSAQFQSLFENVCRCFGHIPANNNGNNGEASGPSSSTPQQHQSIEQVPSTTSAGARRRTNRLELKDKQWDELFEKNQQGSRQQQPKSHTSRASSLKGQPPRPEGYQDHETAKTIAQAKLAANPPRYRTKRKRSAQSREEIFRSRDDRNPALGRKGGVRGSGPTYGNRNSQSSSNYVPQADFSRLLNPSLALCFATPIRGTEEEQDDQDLRSLDNSDTATLNTNGEDTITSTLYFDSKYAHIQESRPPMPLFSQFKIGQDKDEIQNIMASDSHSSLRMIKLMQQQQQQQLRDEIMKTPPPNDDSSSSDGDAVGPRTSLHSRRSAGTIKGDHSGVVGMDHDEEMQDTLPDVKAVSSSTDSSRLSNTAAKHQRV
jgi:hypothetical protein